VTSSADEDVVNAQNTDHSQFQFAVTAGKHYIVEFSLLTSGDNTTGDFEYRYVVTAGGGAPLYSIDASLGLKEDLSRKFFHFVGFKIAGTRIEGHVYDPDGVEDLSLAFKLCEHP